MKKPEEIKIGLGCMINSDIECEAYPYREDNYLFCSTGIVKDAIACIQQLERDKNWASENYDLICEENKRLEAQNTELKRELDAAIYDLKKARDCRSCKHIDAGSSEQPCKSCGIYGRNYEWRGPCKENGGVV